MQFLFKYLLLSYFFLLVNTAEASALTGPSCQISAEVVASAAQGENNANGFIYFKILSVDKNPKCPVKKNQLFKVIDNNPGVFIKGTKIRSGIELGSAMSPSGPISFLEWSGITKLDGSPILSKDGRHPITRLQSDNKAVTHVK